MIFTVFIIGLILGSFLNCLVWRLYKNESIWGRSYCPKCHKQIAWYDNIPVLSFIFLKGKCRHCHKNISWQYPIVELITAILLTLSFYNVFGLPTFYDLAFFNSSYFNLDNLLLIIRDWIFVFTLIVVFIFDFKWQEVPMLLVWPATTLVLILNFFIVSDPSTVIISAVIGLSFFLIQYLLTAKKGIGEGDIWLGLFIGAYFANWQILLVALFLSYIIGSIISIYLLKKNKKLKSKIALGPFLVIGSMLALFFGSNLLNYYLGFLTCC
ncbi:MAG: prepilin peptidase [Patescibacteria group bacterium]|jgi:leader peptidase (prepilin peptidase)/N-methyltransferase|nr:prepilin peptidase [Patescibacteria group bacterium]